jgi:hypothetical protein
MTTVHVEVQMSSEELLKAVKQLDTSDLESFVSEVIALKAQRKAPAMAQTEANLLLAINHGIPAVLKKRYSELIAKRVEETLTSAEKDELLRLGEQVEQVEAKRIEDLAQLAILRQMSLTALMRDLDIQPAVDI